jgi:hypothetical protein
VIHGLSDDFGLPWRNEPISLFILLRNVLEHVFGVVESADIAVVDRLVEVN